MSVISKASGNRVKFDENVHNLAALQNITQLRTRNTDSLVLVVAHDIESVWEFRITIASC